MSKKFEPRTIKKDRKTVSMSSSIEQLLKRNDEILLRGAQLSDVKLNKIVVREQVRTKFNEDSLKELADNIKINGLIQPLVIHRERDRFVLLCGERRYRALRLLGWEEAPCFILEGKKVEELMAIQFSENSSREELHYIDKADGIYNYHKATGASERKIEQDLGISKTEVHRSILLAKLSESMKEAAKSHDIEKYVLLEFDELPKNHPIKDELEDEIVLGNITKRSELKKFLQKYPSPPLVAKKRRSKKNTNENLTVQ